MAKKADRVPFSNKELRLTATEEAERKKLVKQLEKALALGIQSKKDQAIALAKLRPLYSKPGCKGKWKQFLTSKGLSISTANGLIKRYNDGWEEPLRKPKPRLNKPNSGPFTGPHLALTDKPFHDGKEILEAAFLLTPDEKEQFMEALRIIGPERALGVMVKAVIEQRESILSVSTRQDNQMIPAESEAL